MKIMLGSRRHNYVARVGVLLVIVILIGGTIGCAEPPQYGLTISSTEGGEITTPGDDTFSYDVGTEVPLVALPNTGYRFVNWTGDVDTIDDVEDASTTITMSDDYSITANFIKQYDLTISSTTGGSVTTPGEGTYTYDEGEVINLVAQAEGGYHFVNWTGDVSTIANVNAATTSITISGSYVITGNFAVDLYFETEVCAVLDGPAILPPEARNPLVALQVFTNIVMDSVRVDLHDGRSITMPGYTDVFSPQVDQTTVFRFSTCESGMPTAGADYVFTALDMVGEPIPGVTNTEIWLGTDPPDPATNIRAELTEDGILVSWDESPIIPGSFEPAAQPQIGFYQVELTRTETSELVYGAASISASPHLIPKNKTDFIQGKDWGLSLSEMEDGTYCLGISVHSYALKDSYWSREYISSDSGQTITFTIQNGEITIK